MVGETGLPNILLGCASLQKCSSAFLMERRRDARTSCALELRSHP